MAGQRRGEFPGLRDGGGGWGGAPRRLLFLIALSCLSTGCDGRAGGITGVIVGTGTGAGVNTATSPIAGTWRHTLVVRTQTDVITSETTWTFSSGGGCQRIVVSMSLVEGIPLTTRAPCTYQLQNGTVTIQFSGGGPPVSFAVVVSGSHLFLGGTEFVRIG